MDTERQKSITVKRSKSLSNDDLAKHLKAIGKAIIDDADQIFIDTDRLRMLVIKAEIAPLEQVTTVTYTLERTADPRFERG